MRLQSEKPLKLRNKILGGADPLVCIPIVAEEEQELQEAARRIVELCPDIIEWRADYYKDVCIPEKVEQGIRALRSIIGDTPLIFTFRSSLEGGFRKVEDRLRYEIIKLAISTREVDVVDIELACGEKDIEDIKETADRYNVPLILSFHSFNETPSVEFLLDKIRKQVSSGASIAKIAVMPKSEEDVLNLLYATLRARREIPDIPLITMSMGSLGVISRIGGGIFGSDLTFGAGGKTSAPGQIPIDDLRTAMSTLYK